MAGMLWRKDHNRTHAFPRGNRLRQCFASFGVRRLAGWKACESSSGWDLEKQDPRVLVATELGKHQQKRTLIRVDGRSKLLPKNIRNGQ